MLEYLRQIAIFAKTVEHGSFRKAADVLQLSPSVVSHHIAVLERELDVALLYRSTRKLSLTAEGKNVLASAQMVVDGAERFISAVSNESPHLIGQLTVTLPAVMTNSDLVNRIGQFGKEHPSVKLNLDFSDTPRDIIKEGIDLAIRLGWPQDSALKARKLFKMDRRVVASTSFLESRPVPQTPDDLQQWEWLELSSVGLNQVFTNPDGREVSLKAKSRIVVSSAQALLQLVKNGNGAGALPEFVVEEYIASGELGLVLPDWVIKPIEAYAVWPGNTPKNGLTKRLVEYLL